MMPVDVPRIIPPPVRYETMGSSRADSARTSYTHSAYPHMSSAASYPEGNQVSSIIDPTAEDDLAKYSWSPSYSPQDSTNSPYGSSYSDIDDGNFGNYDSDDGLRSYVQERGGIETDDDASVEEDLDPQKLSERDEGSNVDLDDERLLYPEKYFKRLDELEAEVLGRPSFRSYKGRGRRTAEIHWIELFG
jgi:hypothetical protein